jgi:integrase
VYSKRENKKIRRTFSGRGALAEAKGWRIDALKGVKDRKLRAPTARTLTEEVQDWLAGAGTGAILSKRSEPYKPAVIRNYELALRLRVLPALGDRRLSSLDFADLLELQERLQGAGCSASVIRNTFVPLQAILRRARRRGAIATNPAQDLELPTAGSRERASTPSQAAELLAWLGRPEAAVWATAFYAGLRRGELRALRVRDVDLVAATINVERGWDDKEGPIAPKSRAGRRTVFVVDAVRPYLEPLVAGRDPDALVFGGGPGEPFDPRAVARRAARAWDAADAASVNAEPVERFTLHEARHSFSTWMDHAGISPDRADRYMGHSSRSVSGRYRHLLAQQRVEDRQRFDRYLAGVATGKVVPLGAVG